MARAAVAGVSAFGEREGCAGCDCGCGVTTGAGCGAHAATRRRTNNAKRFMQFLWQVRRQKAEGRSRAAGEALLPSAFCLLLSALCKNFRKPANPLAHSLVRLLRERQPHRVAPAAVDEERRAGN